MQIYTRSWRDELRVLAGLSWPVICTNLLAYTLQVIGQAAVGRLCTKQEFAAAALG